MIDFPVLFWHWWVLGLLLLVVEILAPGFFFLWMAIAGFVTGLIAWLMPFISLNAQLLIFSITTIAAIFGWRIYGYRLNQPSDQPLLNQRGAQYIGRTFNLYEPIINGQGKIKVDDTLWKVNGADCPISSKVKVVACRGTVFEVERVD